MCPSSHGNWFCLVRVSSLWLSVRFNRFFQRLESCRPSSCPPLWKHQHIWPAVSNECLFLLLVGKWCSDISKEKGFLTAVTSNTGRGSSLRVSVTLCSGRHMYVLMRSPLQRETVGLRWCYRHWCLPVWPHKVNSGASGTYFGGHVILQSTVCYFPMLSGGFSLRLLRKPLYLGFWTLLIRT